jgi:hypothetical protein
MGSVLAVCLWGGTRRHFVELAQGRAASALRNRTASRAQAVDPDMIEPGLYRSGSDGSGPSPSRLRARQGLHLHGEGIDLHTVNLVACKGAGYQY